MGQAGDSASAGTFAAVASVGSLGLKAGGDIMKGYGTKAAREFEADKAERAAQFGRVQADLTDTVMRERLNTTLANIDAVRAAGHIDPISPTTAAVEERERVVGERQRLASVTSLRSQSAEDKASADYLRKSGDYAVMQGYLAAGIDVASAVAKAAAI